MIDPNSGRVISFSDALDNGILDDSTKCVMIPSSGEVLSIREAIENGTIEELQGYEQLKTEVYADKMKIKKKCDEQ